MQFLTIQELYDNIVTCVGIASLPIVSGAIMSPNRQHFSFNLVDVKRGAPEINLFLFMMIKINIVMRPFLEVKVMLLFLQFGK